MFVGADGIGQESLYREEGLVKSVCKGEGRFGQECL